LRTISSLSVKSHLCLSLKCGPRSRLEKAKAKKVCELDLLAINMLWHC